MPKVKLTTEHVEKGQAETEARFEEFLRTREDLNLACCAVNEAKRALKDAENNERNARALFDKAKDMIAGDLHGPVNDGYGEYYVPDAETISQALAKKEGNRVSAGG